MIPDAGTATVWYFAYGSNLQRATFCGRRGIDCLRAVPARVPGWRLVFDKPSLLPSGHSTANIVAEQGAEALGVAYEIGAPDLEHVELTEGVSLGNYRRITVAVEPLAPTAAAPVTAYSLGSDRRDPSLLPSTRYLSLVIEGALEHGLPDAWIDWLRSVPAEPERAESIALRAAVDHFLAKRPRRAMPVGVADDGVANAAGPSRLEPVAVIPGGLVLGRAHAGDAMGLLIEGVWQDRWYDTKSSGGRFVRQDSAFRDWIRADGSTRFAPAPGRYHLYVSLACPWAHRTLIFRRLKKLEDAISVSVVHPLMLEHGWSFANPDGTACCTGDPVNHATHLHQVYTRANPTYTGRVTVPVLWDRELGTIVNNESSEIIHMLNSELDAFADASVDLHPEGLRAEIDEINAWVYPSINNGVYRCGFATTQEAYEEAFADLFRHLDRADEMLARRRYLAGDRLTEADVRLFTTLVRFDAVYVGHFKCNLRRIADYPNLSGYLRDVYQTPGVRETVNLEHIKRHYYQSHRTINPTGVVPLGPELDLDAPHGR